MAIAADLVRSARRASGLSQDELAEYSGIDLSAISRYEKGRRDPCTRTLDRLLAATGVQLIAVASRRPTISAAARQIAAQLAEGRDDYAYRSFLVANDALRAETPLNRILLSVESPEPTGDLRLDAALAGIVEYYLGLDHSPLPEWVDEADRFLAELWYIDDSAYGRTHDPDLTPEPLLRRGVVLATDGLSNA